MRSRARWSRHQAGHSIGTQVRERAKGICPPSHFCDADRVSAMSLKPKQFLRGPSHLNRAALELEKAQKPVRLDEVSVHV
jgi:hypothetical protein